MMMAFDGSRLEVEEAADDRLSALPDDILLNILERLRLRWAVRTSTLSRRWRRLPLLLSHLVIDISEFVKEDMEPSTAMASYAAAAQRLLQPAAADRRKLKSLRLAFYLSGGGDRLRSIGQAVAAANVDNSNIDVVVELQLLPEQPSWERTAEHSALYRQRFMSLLDACPGAFRRVTVLSLRTLRFAEHDVPRILSACSHSLRELRLSHCGDGTAGGYVLKVDAPPGSQLATLKIVKCYFARVELVSAPRLARLFLHTWTGRSSSTSTPPLQLGHAPQLRYIWLASALMSFQEPFPLSACLLSPATNTILLSKLYLSFRDEMVWIRPEDPKLLTPMCSNLKELYLHDIFPGCDLNWTLLFLEAAPFLNSFSVKISWHTCQRNKLLICHAAPAERTNMPAGEARSFKHHKMEFLEIAGFAADETLIRYTRLVMERAVNLKRIRLEGMENCKNCEKFLSDDLIPTMRERSFPRNEDEKELVRKQLACGSPLSSMELIMERHGVYPNST